MCKCSKYEYVKSSHSIGHSYCRYFSLDLPSEVIICHIVLCTYYSISWEEIYLPVNISVKGSGLLLFIVRSFIFSK
jgi:hypothetical protein